MQNRLKAIRQEQGLTQEQVAERIGTTKQQYGRLENSKRRLGGKWVPLLADALGVHPGDLWQVAVNAPASERERALLEIFRGLSEPQQEAFVQAADALAKPRVMKKSGNG